MTLMTHSSRLAPGAASGLASLDFLEIETAVQRAGRLYRRRIEPTAVKETTDTLRKSLRALLPVCEYRATTMRDDFEQSRLLSSITYGRQLLDECPVGDMTSLVYLRMLADSVANLARYARQLLPVDPREIAVTAGRVLDKDKPLTGQELQDAIKSLTCSVEQMLPTLQSRLWLLPSDDTDRNLANAALGIARSALRPLPGDQLQHARSLARAATSLVWHLQKVSCR